MIAEASRLQSIDIEAAPAGGYWQQSRRPLASLLFVLPLLAMYEGAMLCFGPAGIRNGADAWLRRLLDGIGAGGHFVLPLLTAFVLLAWHHTTRDPWRVRPTVLAGMSFESALFGFGLVIVAHAQAWCADQLGGFVSRPTVSLGVDAREVLGRVAGYCGAGLYEEVMFRLLLLPLAIWLLTPLIASKWTRVATAIALTSIAFSLAHYVGARGEAFDAFTFTFRMIAGGMFAVLFVCRGFGIAAGAHALYDIFVGWR